MTTTQKTVSWFFFQGGADGSYAVRIKATTPEAALNNAIAKYPRLGSEPFLYDVVECE